MRIRFFLLTMALLAAAPAFAQHTESLSVGQRFHLETGFGAAGSKTLNPHWGRELPTFKTYEGAARLRFPAASVGNLSVEDAISHRRSTRSFSKKPMSLEHLAGVLMAGYGITEPHGDAGRRGVASAGGLYPMELYVIVAAVDSLPAGIYHFRPADTSLERIAEGDFSAGVYEAGNRQRTTESSPATLIIAARFDRTTGKYADRGYRYVYIEAGAICQNVYLQTAALGLGTCAVGAFNDDAVSALIGIDGFDEAPILMMPLGFPAES